MDSTPDPRELLSDQIEALAHTAMEVWPEVAPVLLILQAAMLLNKVEELSVLTMAFAECKIEQIQEVRRDTYSDNQGR